MAARVGTVLSDEHILKECAHYRPIPMKLAARIIDGGSIRSEKSPYSSKPLKYQRQVSRPEHFDAYANSIARNLGNDPEFRGKLHTAYTADVEEHHNSLPPQTNTPPAGPDAFYINQILPILQGLQAGMNAPDEMLWDRPRRL